MSSLVGARPVSRRRCTVKYIGDIRGEEAVMGSEKESDNLSGRKSNVSGGRFVRSG